MKQHGPRLGVPLRLHEAAHVRVGCEELTVALAGQHPGDDGVVGPLAARELVRVAYDCVDEGGLSFVIVILCHYRDDPYKRERRGIMTEGPRLSRPFLSEKFAPRSCSAKPVPRATNPQPNSE